MFIKYSTNRNLIWNTTKLNALYKNIYWYKNNLLFIITIADNIMMEYSECNCNCECEYEDDNISDDYIELDDIDVLKLLLEYSTFINNDFIKKKIVKNNYFRWV